MKNLIVLLSLFLLPTATAFAQSELPSDSIIYRSPKENYKEFGGFLLDMGLMSIQPPRLPKYDLGLNNLPTDYNRLFALDPNISMTQGLSTLFSPSGFGMFGFNGLGSSTQQLQMGTFKLKNGLRINTYGEYNADGYKVRNPSALPWEKNNFKGAFELKSANGAFGIRIEVQQGPNSCYP